MVFRLIWIAHIPKTGVLIHPWCNFQFGWYWRTVYNFHTNILEKYNFGAFIVQFAWYVVLEHSLQHFSTYIRKWCFGVTIFLFHKFTKSKVTLENLIEIFQIITFLSFNVYLEGLIFTLFLGFCIIFLAITLVFYIYFILSIMYIMF